MLASTFYTVMLFIFVSILLGPILLAVGWLVAPRSPSEQKLSPYECGFSPLEGQTRSPLSIAFYLVGILFLLFDLELLVTFPFIASNGPFSSPLGFWTLFWFVALLSGGFAFEIRLGVLLRQSAEGRFHEVKKFFLLWMVVLMLAFLSLNSAELAGSMPSVAIACLRAMPLSMVKKNLLILSNTLSGTSSTHLLGGSGWSFFSWWLNLASSEKMDCGYFD